MVFTMFVIFGAQLFMVYLFYSCKVKRLRDYCNCLLANYVKCDVVL